MTISRITNLCSRRSGAKAAVTTRITGSGRACASRAAEVCPALLLLQSAILVLFLALIILVSAPLTALSAQNGDQIINRAFLYYAGAEPVSASVAVTLKLRTPATIELLQYAPTAASAPTYQIGTTYYQSGSSPTDPFLPVPAPLLPGSGAPLDLSAPLPLLPVVLLHSGAPLFIKVTDLDQNMDPKVAETIVITLTNSLTGDIETLRLTETSPNSGVFIGYCQSIATGGLYNSSITVAADSTTTASYIDSYDASDAVSATTLVDPNGLVFDSMNGKTIDGATVELLNADGSPATVYGDSGLSGNSYPNKVISGGTATDAEGVVYSFPPGGYRFPYVNPGSYILKITPPGGYRAPSNVSTEDIQVLPGAPYAIKQGSRGETFPVPLGPAIRVDIPLDPQSTAVWLTKSANRLVASAGEFIGYELDLLNNDPRTTLYTPIITDILPHGFRYVKGSTKINDKNAADPLIASDGRTLTFSIADIPPASSAVIRYAVAVGAGAQAGIATNTAFATTAAINSNSATATVKVIEPFMKSRTILMGRVVVGACSDAIETNKKGMEGVGIYLEDGTFVISDQYGMFHFEGVRPGAHVVQLDLDSIPVGYSVLPCEENSRFAGRAYSQFIDLQGGSMWRTDFYLGRNETATSPAAAAAGMSPETPGTATVPPQTTLPTAAPASEEQALPAQPAGVKTGVTSAPPRLKSGKPSKEEHAELIAVSSEGMVSFRVLLRNCKDLGEKVKVTLLLPEALLYISGSSNLGGKTIADPNSVDSRLIYTLQPGSDQKFINISLQAFIDGDLPTNSLESAVTVEVIGKDEKPVKTFSANAVVSEDPQLLLDVDAELRETAAPLPLFESPPQQENDRDMYHETIAALQPSPSRTAADAAVAHEESHVTAENDILAPADGSVIVNQINAIRIALDSALTPLLLLDGKEIPADRIGFTMKDTKTGKSLYTYIGVDFGDSGEHTLQLKGVDSFGITRFDKSARIARAGEISSIIQVNAEGNVADGRTPVRIQVQLFDNKQNLIKAHAELTVQEGNLIPGLSGVDRTANSSGTQTVNVSGDGWISFPPVTNSGLYRAKLAYKNTFVDVETYVKPQMRDWILVGLAEGTVGYNTVSGSMENLKASDHEEDLYSDERLALYAKGTIKGEWLLTMAYDTAKKNTGVNGSNSLFQTIDPEAYYSVYADGSTQMYDASSQKKLYLRIERDQFYALFGDYNTGLTVTELSRYSRSMTGIKSEYRSRNFDVNAFGSETNQSFVKDEIRGDGTSGLYRLSRKGIILNSDKITIESRDRFHSEVVTNSVQLSRFIDYSIDYDTGAIFFKSPVPSRDDQLNPVYIVADYEIDTAGAEALTYGGRAAARGLNGRVEVGGSFVREGQVSGDNTLYGVDATAFIAPGTKARVEFATTDNEVGVNQTGNAYYSSTTNDNAEVKQKANAYLAEVIHTGKSFDGRLYYKEQEQGFGLSQQSGSETGTRKFGVESGYRLNNKVTLNGQAYRQYNLADDSVREFLETLAVYNEKQYTLRTGLRYANDKLQEGTDQKSLLATVGASWRTLNQRLTLRADHDQALFNNNDSTDFPTRTIVGIDFQATKATTLFAQEELTFGAAENTNTTRVGVKTTPWSGGTLNSAVVNDMRENSERTFANVGLTQRWQVNPHWAVDGAVDHSETIREKTGYTMNSNVPPSSGGENFTAVSMGANYTRKKLTWSNRVEYRNSDTDDKWGMTSGLINEHGLDWAWTGRLQLYHTQSNLGNSSTTGDLRFGLVYRPPVTRLIILNRLDLIGSDLKSATDSAKGRRIINNLHANWKPNKKTQISFQYGAKYVLEKIDGSDYSGYTDLIGIEGRYDISKVMDLGARASLLHTWETDQYAYSFGPSVGYNVMENAWISAGYNVAGFTDKDFSDANYTAQGPFVQYRFKFDQNSVKDGIKMLKQ